MLHVFAYGSLMFDPELPGRVRERRRAWLPGHRRAFNKASVPRACTADAMAWPELEVPERFRRPVSLVLGTRPGGTMEGYVLSYDRDDAEDLRACLDAREGVLPDQPLHAWSYRPETLRVQTPDGPLDALVYLSNPGGAWHADDLTVAETVRILLRATPRRRPARALGVHYLLETHTTLQSAGIVDPHLEELVETLRALSGPWQAVLSMDPR